MNPYLTRLHSSVCSTQSESDQNDFFPEVLSDELLFLFFSLSSNTKPGSPPTLKSTLIQYHFLNCIQLRAKGRRGSGDLCKQSILCLQQFLIWGCAGDQNDILFALFRTGGGKKKGLQVTKSEGFNHKHGIKNVFFKQLNHDNSSAAMTTIFIVFALFWGMFYYN